MGNFYWLPLLKKLPLPMVEGFQKVKEILAKKELTHCPPIAHSDLEAAAAAPAAPAQVLAPVAATAEKSLFCPPRPKSEWGAVTDLEPRDL